MPSLSMARGPPQVVIDPWQSVSSRLGQDWVCVHEVLCSTICLAVDRGARLVSGPPASADDFRSSPDTRVALYLPRVLEVESLDPAKVVVRFDNGRSVALARNLYKRWLETGQGESWLRGRVAATTKKPNGAVRPMGVDSAHGNCGTSVLGLWSPERRRVRYMTNWSVNAGVLFWSWRIAINDPSGNRSFSWSGGNREMFWHGSGEYSVRSAGSAEAWVDTWQSYVMTTKGLCFPGSLYVRIGVKS